MAHLDFSVLSGYDLISMCSCQFNHSSFHQLTLEEETDTVIGEKTESTASLTLHGASPQTPDLAALEG